MKQGGLILIQILLGLPNGNDILDPTYEYVENLILNKNLSYWSGGSGQTALRCNYDNFESKLYIMADEIYGFYLEYYIGNRKFITSNNDNYSEITEIFIGGEPILVPKAFFLNKFEILKQIKEFFITGEMYTEFNWVDDSTVDWNYGLSSVNIATKTFEEIIFERKKARKERLKKKPENI